LLKKDKAPHSADQEAGGRERDWKEINAQLKEPDEGMQKQTPREKVDRLKSNKVGLTVSRDKQAEHSVPTTERLEKRKTHNLMKEEGTVRRKGSLSRSEISETVREGERTA